MIGTPAIPLFLLSLPPYRSGETSSTWSGSRVTPMKLEAGSAQRSVSHNMAPVKSSWQLACPKARATCSGRQLHYPTLRHGAVVVTRLHEILQHLRKLVEIPQSHGMQRDPGAAWGISAGPCRMMVPMFRPWHYFVLTR